MGITAAITAIAGAYTANQQKQQQKGANYRAEQSALKQEKQLEQQLNSVNKKRPNARAMLDGAAQNARAGQSGTMLTGSQGIDPAALTLGKNTLLGG